LKRGDLIMTTAKYRVYRLSDGEHVRVPCAVFLATDVFSVQALKAYWEMIDALHPDRQYVDDWTELVEDFESWRHGNPGHVKIPD